MQIIRCFFLYKNTDVPRGDKVKIWQKISKSYIFTPSNPPGAWDVTSMKFEQPIDELTVLSLDTHTVAVSSNKI